VTYIDTEATPTEPPGNRHRWLSAVAASAVVAVIAGGLVLADRADAEPRRIQFGIV
jgi:ABC-type Zn uptake system ZnuABC Zn-binding protein ZnuA